MMDYSVNDSILWTAARAFALGLALGVFGLALAAMFTAPIWIGAMVR